MMARSSRRRRQGGQALIVLALVGMAMFSFGAYAIDQGVSMADRRNLQATADAAAVAGARSLSSGAGTANYVAMQYLSANLNVTIPGTCTATTCPAGSYTPTGSGYTVTFADGTGTLDVSVSHSRRSLLAGIMGLSTATDSSAARAGTVSGGGGGGGGVGGGSVPCALCLLNPTDSGALNMTMSSGGITVSGGNTVIDSSSSTAAIITGGGTVTTSGGSNLVVGHTQINGSGGFTPAATTGATAVADPLSQVPVPSVSGTASSYSLSGANGTINPGIYSSISVSGSNITLTMNPGIYVITGTFQTTGSVTITGSGVLLYFACSSYPTACTANQSGGTLSLIGSGVFRITAPTSTTCSSIPATCPYQGLLVFYDRNNGATMAITGSGTGPAGTIYGKSATLALTVSGGATVSAWIVMDSVTFTGGGTLGVSYQASQNYSTPSSGASLLR